MLFPAALFLFLFIIPRHIKAYTTSRIAAALAKSAVGTGIFLYRRLFFHLSIIDPGIPGSKETARTLIVQHALWRF
jgi:hypothetical protein